MLWWCGVDLIKDAREGAAKLHGVSWCGFDRVSVDLAEAVINYDPGSSLPLGDDAEG